MELYCYQAAGVPALSALPDLPLPRLPLGADCPERFLLRRGGGRAVFCPSDPRQLFAQTEDVRFLSPDSLGEIPDLPSPSWSASKTGLSRPWTWPIPAGRTPSASSPSPGERSASTSWRWETWAAPFSRP